MAEINAPHEHSQNSDTQILPIFNGQTVTIKMVCIIFAVVVVCMSVYGWINAELYVKADRADLVKAMDKQDITNNEIKSELSQIKVNMARVMTRLGVEEKK